MTRLPSAALLLRISSGLTLLFAACHTMGAAKSWSPVGDSDCCARCKPSSSSVGRDQNVLALLYGLRSRHSLFLLLQAALLWLLACSAASSRRERGPSSPPRRSPTSWARSSSGDSSSRCRRDVVRVRPLLDARVHGNSPRRRARLGGSQPATNQSLRIVSHERISFHGGSPPGRQTRCGGSASLSRAARRSR